MGPHRPARYNLAGIGIDPVDVLVDGDPAAASVAVGDNPAVPAGIRAIPGSSTAFSVDYGGETRVFDIAREADAASGRLWIGHDGLAISVAHRSRSEEVEHQLAGLGRDEGAASPQVRSPMPGTVIALSVTSGDTVAAGDTLLTVEAMKMEHKLTAALSGTVTIGVAPGDLVKLDQIVATIDADPTIGSDQTIDADQNAGASDPTPPGDHPSPRDPQGDHS
jgi:acetyl-CoA/propionyl-CoA carboxylase biotin carboxyl carrier protein